MRVLALDTTTVAGSVAIVDGDRVLVERTGDASRSHAERLPGDILRALDACRLASSDIDLFAIAAGPGSFTGLRIGIATIQGLAFVHRKRVVPVSALEALAEAASDPEPAGRIIGTWMDAHRRDVFSALFATSAEPPFAAARLVHLESPAVGDPGATLERWSSAGQTPDVLVGDGTTTFCSVVPERIRILGQIPLAGVIGRMAVARADDAVDPAAVQPLYIRRPDAEIARDALWPSSSSR